MSDASGLYMSRVQDRGHVPAYCDCPGRADLVPRPHVLLVPQYVDPARDVGALLLQRHHQVQRLVVKT